MVVKVENNVISVISDLPAAVAKRAKTLTVVDQHNNEVYSLRLDLNGKGALGKFGMVANTEIEGNLAVVLVEPLDTTKEQMKEKYGEAILAAKQYIPQLTAEACAHIQAIDEAFGEE